MKLAFFSGCLIPVKYPFMERAIRLTLPALDIDIVDLPGFTCCPDPIYFKGANNLDWLTLAARNLCLAEEKGLDIFTICSGCTATLSEAVYMLARDESLKMLVNRRLARIGKKFLGTVKVRHIVTVLRDLVGMGKIASTVVSPLKDAKIAVHYGCHLLKPSSFMQVDDPDDPQVLENLIAAIGGQTVRHQEWALCCGKACQKEEIRHKMTKCVLDSIRQTGADCMGMICPSCFSSFDLGQIILARKHQDKSKAPKMVPPVYYFQLLGLAQGFSFQEMGLDRHKIHPGIFLSNA